MNQEPTQAEAKRVEMRPIIFSTPMVQAILAGRKTQTRRIVKKQPTKQEAVTAWSKGYTVSTASLTAADMEIDELIEKCPYGKVGDVLYVRETWVRACLSEDGEGPAKGEIWRYWYKADDDWTKHDWDNPNIDGPASSPRWKPSIHMPRAAARIFLKITDISVERLQDITEEDAIAEGVEKLMQGPVVTYRNYLKPFKVWQMARCSFESLWQSMNGEDSWEQNPWIWKISFERIETPTL